VAEGEHPREDTTRGVETDEELLRKVEEQLRDLKVSDVLLQTVYTISSLGWHKLSATDRDLEQAKLSIDALRALLPVLAEAMPVEVKRDLEQMVANMQLAYANAVSESAAPPGDTADPPNESTPAAD
jgi:hypothetical protein